MKERKEIAYGTRLPGNQVRNQNLEETRNTAGSFILVELIHVSPGRIVDFSNADTAVDQYHRFKVNSTIKWF